MRDKTISDIDSAFKEEVLIGLTDYPKHLSSKYIYDEIGDRIFQEIMEMPEYYLTNCEFGILERHKEEIGDLFSAGDGGFDLIELGAGDGKKTKILLRHMQQLGIPFRYMPIDISQNALDQLEASLAGELPGLTVIGKQGTYFEMLEELYEMQETKKVILFLGSNIGNLLHPQAVEFLTKIRKLLGCEDLLFIGFDQKKHPGEILEAYNDKSGITEAFNKNLLYRINRELGGNFVPERFLHWEVYDPETGTAKSYLVAKEPQQVTVEALDLRIAFKAWETIHMEISQKYDDDVVEWLSEKAGLKIERIFSDEEDKYKNYVLKKKEE